MHPRHLLSIVLVLLSSCLLTEANAQCQKSQSTCTKSQTETKKSCSDTPSHCQAYRTACCEKKENKWPAYSNTILVLGAATIHPENNNTALATGLEYNRQLNQNIGVGALAELRLNSNKDISLRFGVPVNFKPIRQIQISAAPLLALNRNQIETVTGGTYEEPLIGLKEEWSNQMGLRAGLSYLINIGNIVVAPTVKADYLQEKIEPTFGVNLGLGF